VEGLVVELPCEVARGVLDKTDCDFLQSSRRERGQWCRGHEVFSERIVVASLNGCLVVAVVGL